MPPRRAAAAAARALRRSPSPSSPASVIDISGESDFAPDAASASASPAASPSPALEELEEEWGGKPTARGTKRKRAAPRGRAGGEGKNGSTGKAAKATTTRPKAVDIEDCVPRPHGREYHAVEAVAREQERLLEWFEGVRDTRGMPWRKRYDAAATEAEKGQRAYEVWVSEVMLQQTQVATVIDYWKRWMEKWPTVGDLANADLEEVNAVWRGLGYYRRAKSLLAGAGVIMGSKAYSRRLPSDPDVLEKDVPGVGRYTAGAICSIAYGVRTPIVDGNIHRVLTRLLGVHATQTAPETIRFLWDAAEALVDALPRGQSRGIAGDWNQALMELGATVCRPAPACGECPLRDACHAYAEAELSRPPPRPAGAECTLCEPVPGEMAVTVFPMKKVKKESRVEHEAVVITEWQGAGETRWLFLKRPDKGLLAGLFEPPTTPVPVTGAADQLATGLAFVTELLGDAAEDALVEHAAVAPVPHIFSHINMTYHVQRLVLRGDGPPEAARGQWLSLPEVAEANVGTGVKKCWASVYGVWGGGEVVKGEGGKGRAAPKRKKPAAKRAKKALEPNDGGRVVKKVCMPMMPRKAATKEVEGVKAEVEVVVIDD